MLHLSCEFETFKEERRSLETGVDVEYPGAQLGDKLSFVLDVVLHLETVKAKRSDEPLSLSLFFVWDNNPQGKELRDRGKGGGCTHRVVEH